MTRTGTLSVVRRQARPASTRRSIVLAAAIAVALMTSICLGVLWTLRAPRAAERRAPAAASFETRPRSPLGASPRPDANAAPLAAAGAEPPAPSQAPPPPGAGVEGWLERAARLLAAGGGSTVDLAECRRQLAKAIERDPDVAGRLVEMLAERPGGGALALLAIEALGEAGTEAAQAGLAGIVRQDASQEVREAALLALARVERPAAQVDALFQSLHEEGGPLAAAALLGLGAVGDRVREGDPARFAGLERYLVESLEGGRLLPQEDLLVLEAIGNLGPGAPPAAVRRAFDSADDLVRESAARSLRKTRGPEAGDLLAAAALRDPSITVRLAAVSVLAERGASWETLARVLAADRSEDVRAAALRALGPDLERVGEIAPLIERAGRSDPSELVRREAERILGSPGAL